MNVQTATRLFLGHSPGDRGLVHLLGDRLGQAGFDVEPFTASNADQQFEDNLRTALTSADQASFLITRQFAASNLLAVEFGAARMAELPISILYDGIDESELPDFVLRYPCYPVDEIARFIDESMQAA